LIHSGTMQNIRRNRLVWKLALGALLFVSAQPACGLILHPDGEPNLASWTDRPFEEVVGRWGSFSGCVAISPDCVITTRHQMVRATTPVTIGGRNYAVAEIWDHETADLRIARLEGANLSHFVGLYVGGSEVSKHVVIAGYGAGRGRALQRDGIVYGYEWDGPESDRLRFGDNRVYHVRENAVMGDIISDVLIADFDGPNEGGSTTYECTLAARDSGGGWFIKTGRTWKLAGLSRAVDIHFVPGHQNDLDYALYEAWFREGENPGTLRPDHLDAVRIRSYAGWISDTVPPALPGDLNGDGRVDFGDFAVFCSNWRRSDCAPPDDCLQADFEHDGDVDAADLIQLADMWLLTYAAGDSPLP
jgi:hypothetical protein